MLQFVLRRIIIAIPVLIGVTFIIFTMMYFTEGDPTLLMLGEDATPEQHQELRDRMGLDDPFLVQYGNYLFGILRGDLGTSFTTGLPVIDEILPRIPITLRLAVLSTLLAIIIGIPAGIFSAVRQYSILDNIIMVFATMSLTIPNFWLALLLLLFFSVHLGWLPSFGLEGPLYYILPVLSISMTSLAVFTRMTRSSMLEVIRQDYIRTAHSKGQSEMKIIFKHALKNALIPIITIIGLQFAVVLGGAVVNETVFSIPGLGRLMVDAIRARNYPVVQGGVLVIAFMFVLLNLIVDLLYAFVDPRIKTQYQNASKQKKKKKALVADGKGGAVSG